MSTREERREEKMRLWDLIHDTHKLVLAGRVRYLWDS